MATSDSVLLFNAKIWHFDGKDFSWMSFSRTTGFISGVGYNNPPVERFSDADKIDCKQSRILPGFHESHIHLTNLGRNMVELNLEHTKTFPELQDALRNYIAKHPEKEFYRGRGWNQRVLGQFFNKELLDEVCSTKHILLLRVCHHVGVVNSSLLNAAGIDSSTKDPPGGEIERYPPGHAKAGQPTGLLKESAIDLVKPFISYSLEDNAKFIQLALDEVVKHGVTSAHTCEENTWDAFRYLARNNLLNVRILLSAIYEYRSKDTFPTLDETCGPLLSCNRIKLLLDGSLGGCTACLSVPYIGTTDTGCLIYTQEKLNALMSEALAEGYRMEMHVIGDQSADQALTALEAVNCSPEKRPVFVHSQILRKDLIERMKRQGVIASIQPQFLPTDVPWMLQVVPEQLHQYSYAWKTLLKSGVPCCGGSDAPVELPQPLLGMYDAIYRKIKTKDTDTAQIYCPDECLSFNEALDIYTRGGAYAAKKEDTLGQLLPGYIADFVVFEKDICAAPEQLNIVHPSQVWVGGKCVFDVTQC